jgi:hypothetical protein
MANSRGRRRLRRAGFNVSETKPEQIPVPLRPPEDKSVPNGAKVIETETAGPQFRMLERSSLEAYGAILLTVLAVELPVTWWLKGSFWLVAAALLIDLSWRSPWTFHLGKYRWGICIAVLVLLSCVALPLTYKQFTEDKAGALIGELQGCVEGHDCLTSGSPMLQFGDSGGGFLFGGHVEEPMMQFAKDAGILVSNSLRGPELTTTVRDRSGNTIVHLEKNVWTVFPPFCSDKNYTQNTLEVKDSRHHVVLWVRVLNDRIQIQGEWQDGFGAGIRFRRCPDPKGQSTACYDRWLDLKGEAESEELIEPMFEYPSRENWGRIRNIWPIPKPGQILHP